MKTNRLVVAGKVRADKADSSTTGAATYCFDFNGVLNPMRRTKVKVVDPGFAAVLTHLHAGMAFRRLTLRHRFVVDVGVINSAIAVDCDGRIGPILLRDRAGHNELLPSRARVRGESAALFAVALIDW